jgi:hypothetical protein
MARAAGPAFAGRGAGGGAGGRRRGSSGGRALRLVLLPLLERLGEPCAPVAAAADVALRSVGRFGVDM